MKKNICVYTCITGEYDNLKEIKNVENNIDYYCFTNNKNIKSKTWNIVYIDDDKLSNVLLARKTKILGNPIINSKYDIELWMDAAVEFLKPINDFIDEYLGEKDNFVCFKHGLRNSIEEEMDACLRFRKESIDKIENLKEFYKKENYNYDNGLVESTVLIKRPNDEKVIETMNVWFDMVKNYTKRDQLSFNYALFKTGLKVKWINEYVFGNDWFTWHEHTKNKIPTKYMIYFGNIDKYDCKYQIEGEYKYFNNKYEINENIKYDTNQIYIELSDIPMIKYKLSISKSYDVEYHNTIDFNKYKVFFKSPGFIIIKGDFKKNDKIRLTVEFEPVEDFEKNEIIDEYVCKFYDLFNKQKVLKSDFSSLQKRYDELMDSYNETLNSKSWKITKPLRTISSKIKK